MAFRDVTFYQLWHGRAHHSPERRWLRSMVLNARHRLSSQAP